MLSVIKEEGQVINKNFANKDRIGRIVGDNDGKIVNSYARLDMVFEGYEENLKKKDAKRNIP